jgi:hypothetical protein
MRDGLADQLSELAPPCATILGVNGRQVNVRAGHVRAGVAYSDGEMLRPCLVARTKPPTRAARTSVQTQKKASEEVQHLL